jgi:hypothetical protein
VILKSFSIIEGQPKFWPLGNIDLPSNTVIFFTWLFWAAGSQILQADIHIIMSYRRVTRDRTQSPQKGGCRHYTTPLRKLTTESVGTTDSRTKPPNAMKPMKQMLHQEEIAKIKISAARTSSNIFMCDLLTS